MYATGCALPYVPYKTCQAVCTPFCAGLPSFHSCPLEIRCDEQMLAADVLPASSTLACKVYRLVFNLHHIFLPDDQDFLHKLFFVLVLFHKLLYILPDYRSSGCQLSSVFHSRYKNPVQKLSVQATLNNLWETQISEINLSIFRKFHLCQFQEWTYSPMITEEEPGYCSWYKDWDTGCGAHPASCGGYRVKQLGHEGDHSPPPKTKFKNEWSCTSIPSCSFMTFTWITSP